MKGNKVMIVLDKNDADKYNEIIKKAKWNNKTLVTIMIRDYYKKFKSDWKKCFTDSMEENKDL